MKKVLVFVFAVLFVIVWSVQSNAMMGGKRMGCMDMGMDSKGMHDKSQMADNGKSHMTDKLTSLGLDEKQTKYVKAVHSKFKKEVIKKRADIEIAEIELKEILANDPVDIKTAETKIRLIEGIKTEIKIMHLKLMEDIKGKLTMEQRKKFGSMMETCQMDCGMGMKGKCRMMQGMGEMDDADSKGEEDVPMPPPPVDHQH